MFARAPWCASCELAARAPSSRWQCPASECACRRTRPASVPPVVLDTASCPACSADVLCPLHAAAYDRAVGWLRGPAGTDRPRLVFDQVLQLVTTSTREHAARVRARAVAAGRELLQVDGGVDQVPQVDVDQVPRSTRARAAPGRRRGRALVDVLASRGPA